MNDPRYANVETYSSPDPTTLFVQLLVDRVDLGPDGADIRLRTEGLTNLAADLHAVRSERRKAA